MQRRCRRYLRAPTNYTYLFPSSMERIGELKFRSDSNRLRIGCLKKYSLKWQHTKIPKLQIESLEDISDRLHQNPN